jgi:hypothetical protein
MKTHNAIIVGRPVTCIEMKVEGVPLAVEMRGGSPV